MAMQPRPMMTIAFQIPPAVLDGLQELARKAGHPRDLYAANLLIAAYSARRGPTGDAALDEAVAQLNVKHSDQKVDGLAERLRAQLDAASRRCSLLEGALEQAKSDVTRLRDERDQHQAECETFETLLNDEKIANAQLFSELHALKAEVQARADRSTEIDLIGEQALSRLKEMKKPSANPVPDEVPDCTRRMIVALNAAGLRPVEIARDTDTPLHLVKSVLERHQKPRRRA